MGRLVSKVRRWWMLVLVCILALSLTSCSRKAREAPVADYGFGHCDGTLGNFDVYVIRSKGNPGLYEIAIIPASLDQPGDIVNITVANQNLAYKEMQTQVVVDVEGEIFAGYLTESELETYDRIAITPYQPGVSFLEATPEKDAICELPLPEYSLSQ